jgi:hypothetical protein
MPGHNTHPGLNTPCRHAASVSIDRVRGSACPETLGKRFFLRGGPRYRSAMDVRWPGQLTLPIALLLSPGCSRASEDAGQTAGVAVEAASLFESGFAEARRAGIDAAKARDTSYEAVGSVRRAMGRETAANLRRNFSLPFAMPNPEEFVRSGAAAEAADRKLEGLGLPLNDLASASVLLFGVAWELANAQPLTEAQQRALIRQVDAELKQSRDPGVRRREAETRLAIAGLWLEESRLRQGSAEQMRALSDAVQRDMKGMSGNDMRAHDLTEEGFVERQRGDDGD